MSLTPERVGFRFGSAICLECGRRIAVRPAPLWWMEISKKGRDERFFYVHKGKPHPIGRGRARCDGSGRTAIGLDVTPGWDA